MGFLCVALVVLDLDLYTRLAFNSDIRCLCLPSAGIKCAPPCPAIIQSFLTCGQVPGLSRHSIAKAQPPLRVPGSRLLARLEGRSSLKELEPNLFADEDSPVHA
ncbi:DNA repair protein XRCC2 [Apodemus speciosus]|uniref:DNA repair protein XRCC2 n=1 Tax=Apodemus speciosus TaxID=105296 RepID=A0ABQ0ER05_APOSI